MSNQQGAGLPAVELLAPAGGAEALHAAVAGGADAVYLGLDAFNARRNADNFTLETLGEACDYAHLRGVRVYVTLNTAILPSEVDRALECARQAYRAGADAFIVQDVGVAAELSRSLSQARLHISTQMNTHNAAGIEAAAKLGARRVTLARELSLAEVEHLAHVASDLGLEVEAFAHGALCVCYSGQCFMSSMIGGRSANRGLCAQACRLPYELRNRAQRKELPSPGEHLLSPQDLCAIDLMPELVAAGAASLKIEGRNKKAFYVASVVHAYRRVLDGADPAEGAAELACVSHRPYSTGFYYGPAEQSPECDGYVRECLHAADVRVCAPAGDGAWRVEAVCRNRFCEGDELEAVVPGRASFSVRVRNLAWLPRPEADDPHPSPVPAAVANRSAEAYAFSVAEELAPGGFLRIREQGHDGKTRDSDQGI